MKTFLVLCSILFTISLSASTPIPVGPEYDTLTDLLAHQPLTNNVAKWYFLKGTNTIGDSGAGDFYWLNGSAAATNADSIFAWGPGRLFKVSAASTNYTVAAGTVVSVVTNVSGGTVTFTVNGRPMNPGQFVWDGTNWTLVNVGPATNALWTSTAQQYVRPIILTNFNPLNVKWFGAVGDGVTDDTASVAAALAFASSNRSSLYFPGATYRVTSPLIYYSRMQIYGDSPEAGSNLADTNTVFLFDHTGDGFIPNPAENPGSGTLFKNFRAVRGPGRETTNALIRLSNTTGSRLENLYLWASGNNSLGVVLSNCFNNSIQNIKIFDDGTNAIGLDFLYPTTVTDFTTGMIQVGNGVGTFINTQNNTFNCVDWEFCATAVKTGHFAGLGNANGSLFQGCHFEASTVADIDCRGEFNVPMTFIGCYFTENGGGTQYLTTSPGDVQNFIIVGVDQPFDGNNAFHYGKFGPFILSGEPFSSGVELYIDGETDLGTSFLGLELFKNNTNTGHYFLRAWHPVLGTNAFWNVTTENFGSMYMQGSRYGQTFLVQQDNGGTMQLGNETNGTPKFGVGGPGVTQITANGTNAVVSAYEKSNWGVDDNNFGFSFYADSGLNSGYFLQNAKDGRLRIGVPSGDQITIKYSGNVGINDTNPPTTLAVKGDVTITGQTFQGQNINTSNNVAIIAQDYPSNTNNFSLLQTDHSNRVVIAAFGTPSVVGGSMVISNNLTIKGVTYASNGVVMPNLVSLYSSNFAGNSLLPIALVDQADTVSIGSGGSNVKLGGDTQINGQLRVEGTNGPTWTSGLGAPTSSHPVGSIYSRSDGSSNSSAYLNVGTTNWIALPGTGSGATNSFSINNTNNFIPYRLNATTLADSSIEQVAPSIAGVHGRLTVLDDANAYNVFSSIGTLTTQGVAVGTNNPVVSGSILGIQVTEAGTLGLTNTPVNSPTVSWHTVGYSTNDVSLKDVTWGAYLTPSPAAVSPGSVWQLASTVGNDTPTNRFAITDQGQISTGVDTNKWQFKGVAVVGGNTNITINVNGTNYTFQAW